MTRALILALAILAPAATGRLRDSDAPGSRRPSHSASESLRRPIEPMPSATQRFGETYLAQALAAGCPPDQTRRFLAAGIVMQAQQLKASAAARLCDRPCAHPEEDADGQLVECTTARGCAPNKVGYGGARGGGKSHWGLAQIMADDCGRYPGLKFLYLRKVGKAGKEAIQDLRREVLYGVPHEYKVADNMLVRTDNGSRVVLGHFQTEKDIDAYLGLQYDGALIEEATQLTSRKIRDIGTCVRTSKPGWRPRQYFTTNPGNIGHAWFKALFIDPMRAGAEVLTRFVQATVRDNRFVNAGYRQELEALTGWQRAAWLDGSWDIAAGQYFTTFRREVHVRETPQLMGDWRFWLSLDYGFTHYTAAYLFARSHDGTVYVVDEHAERGRLVPDHAEAIKAMLGRHGLEPGQLRARVAGSDVFSKERDGRTIADDYADHGIDLEPAVNDRINGAAEVLRRLGDPGRDEGPRPATVFIDPRCARLADCLPAMCHDPNRPEDVLKVDTDDDGIGGDDPYDSFRYGLMVAADAGRAFVGRDPNAGHRG